MCGLVKRTREAQKIESPSFAFVKCIYILLLQRFAHWLPCGHPMHLSPRFFDLMRYITVATIIAARIVIIMMFSILISYPYMLDWAFFDFNFLFVLSISAIMIPLITSTAARPMSAAPMFKDAGETISVPTV